MCAHVCVWPNISSDTFTRHCKEGEGVCRNVVQSGVLHMWPATDYLPGNPTLKITRQIGRHLAPRSELIPHILSAILKSVSSCTHLPRFDLAVFVLAGVRNFLSILNNTIENCLTEWD